MVMWDCWVSIGKRTSSDFFSGPNFRVLNPRLYLLDVHISNSFWTLFYNCSVKNPTDLFFFWSKLPMISQWQNTPTYLFFRYVPLKEPKFWPKAGRWKWDIKYKYLLFFLETLEQSYTAFGMTLVVEYQYLVYKYS